MITKFIWLLLMIYALLNCLKTHLPNTWEKSQWRFLKMSLWNDWYLCLWSAVLQVWRLGVNQRSILQQCKSWLDAWGFITERKQGLSFCVSLLRSDIFLLFLFVGVLHCRHLRRSQREGRVKTGCKISTPYYLFYVSTHHPPISMQCWSSYSKLSH